MAPAQKQQHSLEQGLKDLNLTNEELNKFEKAFKDPEFLRLFEEYAKEVSDPKVKAETDQYLRELEQQGRGEDVYGKGVVLVAPQPALVLKSKVMGSKEPSQPIAGAAGGKRDSLVSGQKVFINVCTSEKVDRYSLHQARDANGRSGQQMSIPITLGPMRHGTDKQGQPAAVYDLVVHPETVEFASRSVPVMNTLAETALEQIEKVSHSRLSRGWRRLNSRYKATEGCTEPPVQCIRTEEGGQAVDGRLRPRADVPAVHVPGAKFAAEVRPQPSAAAAAAVSSSNSSSGGGGGVKGPASRSTFSFDRPKDRVGQSSGVAGGVAGGAAAEAEAEAVQDPCQPGYRHADGAVTPEWALVHRGQADLAAAWGDAGRGLALDTRVPKELLVRVTLPEVTSAAAVDLDVGERRLTLKVPGRYALDVSLPYAVDESKGKAKFDKARKQLEITLPVVPPPLPPPPPLRPQVAAAAVQDLPEAPSAAAAEDEVAARPPLPQTAAPVAGVDAPGAGSSTSTEVERAAAASCDDASAEVAAAAAGDKGLGTAAAVTGQREHQPEIERQAAAAAEVTRERGREDVCGGGGGGVPQMTENERKWRELHARRAEEAEPALGGGEDSHLAAAAATLSAATSAAATSLSAYSVGDAAAAAGDAAAAVQAATAASVAVPEREEPTVLLQPRLRRDLAMELD